MKLSSLLIMLLITINLLAQDNKWSTEFSEDGKTEVVYAIFDSLDSKGEEVTYIEYKAATNSTASLKKCSDVFNNPDMHKNFYDYTEVSEKIKDISENEWIIYYYYSPPWPIADSDCVSRITEKIDSINNKITFTSFSEPNLLEMKEVTRSELNDITFTLTKINDSEVEIYIKAKLIPATQAPKWMMNGWFPEGPASILSRFKELAENL